MHLYDLPNNAPKRAFSRWLRAIQGLALFSLLTFGLLSCGALPCDDDSECPGSICHPVQKVCLDKGVVCVSGNERSCTPDGQTLQTTGLCKPGTQTCSEAGAWGDCLGTIVPTAEVCDDKLDNDCDGQIDEGCELKAFCNNLQLNDLLSVRALYVPQEPDARTLTVTLASSSQVVWDGLPTASFAPASWRVSQSKLSPPQTPTTLTLTVSSTESPQPSTLQVSLKGTLRFSGEKNSPQCEIEWSSGQLSFACPGALVLCEGTCIDVDKDPRHCGKCGVACSSRERCSAGRCLPVSCEQGKSICQDKCVDTQVEVSHCGTCNNACPTGQICRDARCRLPFPACPGTTSRCDETCVDLAYEIAHCGRCNNTCKAGEACEKGACVPCKDCPLWGVLGEVQLNHVALDAKGNIYIAGHYTKASQFGTLALKPVGDQELLVAKLSPEGKFLWVRHAATLATGSIVALSFAVSATGKVHIAGSFTKGISFGKQSYTSKGGSDAFLLTLDTRGDWSWAKVWGGKLNDTITRIDASPDNVVAALATRGNVVIDGKSLVHKGDTKLPNYSVIQLSASGAVQWHHHFRFDSIQEMNGLQFDLFGNVYVAAQFRYLVGVGNIGLITHAHDATFLVKFSSKGMPFWARQFGSASVTTPRHLIVDSLNNVIVTGTFNAPMSVYSQSIQPAGKQDIFIIKWDSKGDLKWLTSAGGPHDDVPHQLASDKQNRIYLVGAYQETLRLGEMTLLHKGQLPSGFLAQLDANGGWVGVIEQRAAGEVHTKAIATNALDQLYLLSTFEGKTLSVRQAKFNAMASIGNSMLFKLAKPGTLCTEDDQICKGACVMYEFSRNHCGGCGKACKTGDVCERGSCKPCTNCSAWVALGGTNASLQGYAHARGVARDSQGNIYSVGSFVKSINFGSTQLTAKGIRGAYLAKLDSAGKWQWAKALDSTAHDTANALTVDTNDNVYWAGSSEDPVRFEGTALPGGGSLFICKMTPAGTLAWIATASSSLAVKSHTVNDIITDSSGNSYVTGYYYDGIKFGNTTLAARPTGYDAFLAKLDSKGKWVWATRLGGSNLAQGRRVRLDSQGNVYWVGILRSKATYGTTTIDGGGVFNVFVAKADNNGKPLWIKSAGDFSTDDRGEGLAVDATGAYISGTFNGTINFDTTRRTSMGREDIFVAKIDPNGTWQWARTYGGQSVDSNRSLNLNSKGELLIAGEFAGTGNFGTMQLGQYGAKSIYVLHIDTNGKLLGGFSGGGPSEENCFGGAIVDRQDRIIIAGHTESTWLHFGGQQHRRSSPLAPVPFVAQLTSSRPCPPIDHAICSNVCTNLKTDTANCGACGNACGSSKRCVAGVCQ